MSEPDEDYECRYCIEATEVESIESIGRFIAALEANNRLDGVAFEMICDSADAMDYHTAVNICIDILNSTAELGVDVLGTLKNMRDRCNAYAAEAE